MSMREVGLASLTKTGSKVPEFEQPSLRPYQQLHLSRKDLPVSHPSMYEATLHGGVI